LIHEPWKLNPIEQQFIIAKEGTIVQYIEETRKYASDIVWSFRKKDEVKEEGKRLKNMFLTLTSKKDKIIMTLFLKAGGKHHNGQL
jgi:deoxyribodipyrimidine photo-lyase